MSLTNMRLKKQRNVFDSWCCWSDDRLYRYVLYRKWHVTLPNMTVIGLNPSVADEKYDDMTVRKCVTLARRLGHGSLTMLNIFAFRATNPDALRRVSNPVGTDNDTHILHECNKADTIVVAWGGKGYMRHRHMDVMILLRGKDLWCFGKNMDGTPTHPLYLPYNVELIPYKW